MFVVFGLVGSTSGAAGRSILGTTITAFAAVAQVGLLSGSAEAQRSGRRGDVLPAVSLAAVKIEKVNERVAAVGSGRARQQVTLTTRVAGVIAEVLFEGGQLVELNQPLVRLLAEPEAIAVETAAAQRQQAADTVDRYNQLNEGTVTRVAKAEARRLQALTRAARLGGLLEKATS